MVIEDNKILFVSAFEFGECLVNIVEKHDINNYGELSFSENYSLKYAILGNAQYSTLYNARRAFIADGPKVIAEVCKKINAEYIKPKDAHKGCHILVFKSAASIFQFKLKYLCD